MTTEKKILSWVADPIQWANDRLRISVFTHDQADVLRAVVENKYVVVKSANGVGKTFLAAVACLWFFDCFPNSVVITTAPTHRQVRELLWKEIGAMYGRLIQCGGDGEFTQLKLKRSESWFVTGFSAKVSADAAKTAEKMQGFHAPYIFFAFDEAPGVVAPFWDAIRGSMQGDGARFLAIGNPTSAIGKFAEAFKSDVYFKKTISALNHPNYISGEELIPGAVTREWVEEVREEYGEDSPFYISRVLGEFPPEGENFLFPLRLLQLAVEREVEEKDQANFSLGIDVARMGKDFTSLILFNGLRQVAHKRLSKRDTVEVAAAAKQMLVDADAPVEFSKIVVDDTGVGGGVTDILTHEGFNVLPVNFGQSPRNKEKFANAKAEIFWHGSELLKNEEELKIQDAGKLVGQLSSLTYDIGLSGKIEIISKKELEKKGFSSPDDADAFVLALWGLRQNRIDSFIETKDDVGDDELFADIYSQDF